MTAPSPRGKGWRPDDPARVAREQVERHVSRLLGACAPLDGAIVEVDYTGKLDRVVDQQNTESCVGHAFSTAMLLTARLAGLDVPRPSPKLIYDGARLKDQPYAPLVDDGSSPLSAVEVLSSDGMVAEADWPLTFDGQGGSNVNVPPVLGVYERALGAKLGDYFRVPPGAGAFDLLCQAIGRDACPVFAMPVDEAYERFSGDGVYAGRTGVSLGGHMQAIAGYGDGYVIVAGSWGPYWADGGKVRISKDYIESGECTDFIVPTVIPVF